MRGGVGGRGDGREVRRIEAGLLETEDRPGRNAELVFILKFARGRKTRAAVAGGCMSPCRADYLITLPWQGPCASPALAGYSLSG
jgi:hypothetical protein